jgi:hypothetical protein
LSHSASPKWYTFRILNLQIFDLQLFSSTFLMWKCIYIYIYIYMYVGM